MTLFLSSLVGTNFGENSTTSPSMHSRALPHPLIPALHPYIRVRTAVGNNTTTAAVQYAWVGPGRGEEYRGGVTSLHTPQSLHTLPSASSTSIRKTGERREAIPGGRRRGVGTAWPTFPLPALLLSTHTALGLGRDLEGKAGLLD